METTSPARRIRYSSSPNSRVVSATSAPPRVTRRRGRVERHLADRQHGRPCGRAPAQQRAQPGQQHHVRERLGQVVVGAAVEPVGLVVLAVLGREHQHRHPVLFGPQRPDHLVAGQAGQHHVEDHRVVVAVAGRVRARSARRRRRRRRSPPPAARAAARRPAAPRPRPPAAARHHRVPRRSAPAQHALSGLTASRTAHDGRHARPLLPAGPAVAAPGRGRRRRHRRRRWPSARSPPRPTRPLPAAHRGPAPRRRADGPAGRPLRHRRRNADLGLPALPGSAAAAAPTSRRCSPARTRCGSGTPARPGPGRPARHARRDRRDPQRHRPVDLVQPGQHRDPPHDPGRWQPQRARRPAFRPACRPPCPAARSRRSRLADLALAAIEPEHRGHHAEHRQRSPAAPRTSWS